MNEKRNKQLIIHDLEQVPGFAGKEEGALTIDARGIERNCTGCFGCWTKTPGTCVIRDGFEDIGAQFAQCDELVVVSRCVYGGFSPEVKNILDRCISYLMPFFTLREDGKMHHVERYPQRLSLAVHFYGDIHPQEEWVARRLVERNALNLNAKDQQVHFYTSSEELEVAGA